MASFWERITSYWNSTGYVEQTNYSDNKYSSPVDEYISNVVDFQRAYLFKVFLTFPTDLQIDANLVTKATYLARSTTLPDITTEEVYSYYMGVQMKHSSVRRFGDWQLNLYVDKGSKIIEALYKWNQLCVPTNVDNFKYGEPNEYMSHNNANNVQVINLLNGESKKPIMYYKLYGAWPKSINNISLDYESNQFLTADVTFAYQYFEIKKVN